MESYYKIMNICDAIALDRSTLTNKVTDTLDALLHDVGCEICDIGDANDIVCDTWQELIEGLQGQFEHGERVPIGGNEND